MSIRWDQNALAQINRAFAESLGDVVELAAKDAAVIAPKDTGRYARSITWAAFLDRGHVAGPQPHGKTIVHPESDDTRAIAVLYTPSGLGHILELGTAARETEAGAARGAVTPRPHLTPAFLGAVAHAPSMIAAGMRRRLRL